MPDHTEDHRTVPGIPHGVIEDDRVTVVVASRNRREELLASVARHRAAVVYVDNDSTDGSAAAVRAAYPHVDVVELPENVGARARTIGVRRVATPYVAFADDDSWWAPGSLSHAADLLQRHPRLALVHARIHLGPEERLDGLCRELAASPLPRPVDSPGPALMGFAACAAVLRVDAFLDAGGFDDVVRFPGEEERLAMDLVDGDWHLAYVDELLVHHHPSPLRHGPHQRRRGVTRASVLTALMRLPARHVTERVWRAVASGDPATRSGALQALRETPAALRRRHVVSERVLTRLEVLRAGSCGPSAEPLHESPQLKGDRP